VDSDAPNTLVTARLRLRRPTAGDAPQIFARYASDPEVTRYVAWPRHRSVADSRAFVDWSESAWAAHKAGPYLVTDHDGLLLGSTGLDLETTTRAGTGYVLARDAWGAGYATELVRAMVDLADAVGLIRLYALCHPANQASSRVLEKSGFVLEGVLRRHTVFPALATDGPADVQSWSHTR
jgi:RimJ/RimL family protein N-acetyltransferase